MCRWIERILKGWRMVIQLFVGSNNGAIVPTLAGGTTLSEGTSPQTATVSVLRNGTITSNGDDTTFSTQYWHTSGSATIGDSYWVRFTRVTGGPPTYYIGDAVSTWHQITTTRYFGHDSPEGYDEQGTYTIEIASDSGGVTIVSTSASGAYSVRANAGL
jgi:hypothetical protein